MNVIAVGIGGFFGAILRYFTGEWFYFTKLLPLDTLVVNLLGSFLLAFFFTFIIERVKIHSLLRFSLGTGFIGAFTTFSTFSVEIWNLIKLHHYFLAGVYVLLSVIGGIGLAIIGVKLGVSLKHKQEYKGESE